MARFFGGIFHEGYEYTIAHKEDGKPLVRLDVLRREDRQGKAAVKPQGQPQQQVKTKVPVLVPTPTPAPVPTPPPTPAKPARPTKKPKAKEVCSGQLQLW